MTPIDSLLESVDWQSVEPPRETGGLPYATHEGVFELMGMKLRCYRLNTGQAIFNAEDFEKWLDSAV
jgi:hypothetical protein